ncbi:UNVERIFIED_CONTAM: hypothetical protein FKN15_044845 [Acipenser sinensis]
MATYVEILRSEFPEIDSEVFDYITGTASNDIQGIWMIKRGQNSKAVDAKRLEKAEAKLKAKHERRTEKDSQKVTVPLVLEEASASQASNKKDTRIETSGKNKTYDIRMENFDVSYGERSLLQGAEVTLSYGRRFGLVGRNGLGKTTLLKMMASRSLRVPTHISILHVEQEVAGDETPALQSVLESDSVREGLLREERELNTRISNGQADGLESVKLTEVYAKLEEIEADKAPARASVILAGLGFSAKMQQQTTKEFSGGWRMRLALARALFAKPDLLLLDEPTNMLDVKAILWLENYLQTWQSTILVVSHDRNFLNAVATDIIHLHSQRLDTYRGDYENFVKTKEDRQKSQLREYEAQKQYRDHIQSKLKLLEKLFPDNFEKLSPPVLQLDEVEFYYSPDRHIFRNLCVSADLESRICIPHLLVVYFSPNFYILDEPTNHLDMETIEALAKALNKFKGGVVLVSHDERLIRMVCKELWVCENGTVRRIDGGFDEYREILQEQFRKEGYL